MTRRAYAAYLLKLGSAELGQNLVDTALMKQQRSRDDGLRTRPQRRPSAPTRCETTPKWFVMGPKLILPGDRMHHQARPYRALAHTTLGDLENAWTCIGDALNAANTKPMR